MTLELDEQIADEVPVYAGALTRYVGSHRDYLVYWSEDSIVNINRA